MDQPPITVAIVEDIPEILENLVATVSSDPGLRLIRTCRSGQEAIAELRHTDCRIVLMDIQLPDISGVECVRELKLTLPNTEFMMLTIFNDQDTVFASLRAGATGYLVKGVPPEEILNSIRELDAGDSPMSSSIARKVVRALQQSGSGADPSVDLTSREEEILSALASGKRYKEIAQDCFLSIHTVRNHIHNIYEKLHVRSKAQAIRRYNDGRPDQKIR